MNSLPNELLFMIWEHLSFKDLLRCRLVCKHLKSICDQVKIQELAIGQSDISSWFYFELISDDDTIENELALNSTLFNLKYLKHLEINSLYSGKVKIDDLNKFIYLEYLKIEFLMDKRELKLSLPNLKGLFLNNFSSNLVIETPKLEKIFCYAMNGIKFVYPESVKKLELDWPANNLEEFKNVEIFTCLHSVKYAPANILEQLPKLKELHFPQRHLEPEDLLDPKEKIRQFIRSKLALGKDDLKIYYMEKYLENGEADLSDDDAHFYDEYDEFYSYRDYYSDDYSD